MITCPSGLYTTPYCHSTRTDVQGDGAGRGIRLIKAEEVGLWQVVAPGGRQPAGRRGSIAPPRFSRLGTLAPRHPAWQSFASASTANETALRSYRMGLIPVINQDIMPKMVDLL